MTFKQRWERLPQWVQVTIYTVLGLAAMAGVGYLGFRLAVLVLSGDAGAQAGTALKILGAAVLLSIVFGGLGRNRRRALKKRNRRYEHDTSGDTDGV